MQPSEGSERLRRNDGSAGLSHPLRTLLRTPLRTPLRKEKGMEKWNDEVRPRYSINKQQLAQWSLLSSRPPSLSAPQEQVQKIKPAWKPFLAELGVGTIFPETQKDAGLAIMLHGRAEGVSVCCWVLFS